MTTLATRRNVGILARLKRDARVYDPVKGELAKIDGSDLYYDLGLDEPLTTSNGCEPLQLVTVETNTLLRDALTGEIIAGEETIDVESIEWRIYDASSESVYGVYDYSGAEVDARTILASCQARQPGKKWELHSRKVSAWEVEA